MQICCLSSALRGYLASDKLVHSWLKKLDDDSLVSAFLVKEIG